MVRHRIAPALLLALLSACAATPPHNIADKAAVCRISTPERGDLYDKWLVMRKEADCDSWERQQKPQGGE